MLSTVNVIQFSGHDGAHIERMASFPDTPEGNQQAEALFNEWASDPGEDALDDGYAEVGAGYVLLVHSTEGDDDAQV